MLVELVPVCRDADVFSQWMEPPKGWHHYADFVQVRELCMIFLGQAAIVSLFEVSTMHPNPFYIVESQSITFSFVCI